MVLFLSLGTCACKMEDNDRSYLKGILWWIKGNDKWKVSVPAHYNPSIHDGFYYYKGHSVSGSHCHSCILNGWKLLSLNSLYEYHDSSCMISLSIQGVLVLGQLHRYQNMGGAHLRCIIPYNFKSSLNYLQYLIQYKYHIHTSIPQRYYRFGSRVPQ